MKLSLRMKNRSFGNQQRTFGRDGNPGRDDPGSQISCSHVDAVESPMVGVGN
jgi:hypothetical protein